MGERKSLTQRVSDLSYLLPLAFICAVGGLCFTSCSTVTRTVNAPPEIEGATFVGNQSCAECHTNITRVFHTSPHAKIDHPDTNASGLTGCESCHGAGSKHVQAGGGRGKFIINPGKDPQSCYQCHVDVHAEFRLPHHHPVPEGRMNCVQCHDPHGHDIMKPSFGLAMSRLNQSCAQCHREQARPVIFEHEAMREGCATCHQPHGSINKKMLTERDNNLCLKCHAQEQAPGLQPGDFYIGKENHRYHLRRGSCWASGCHTAVHGSNVNPRLFY